MSGSIWITAWRFHVRLLRRTLVLKLAFGLALGIAIVFGFNALSGNLDSDALLDALRWATWAAVLATFAALSVPADQDQAGRELLQLRGVSPTRWLTTRLLAGGSLVWSTFSWPACWLGLMLLVRTDSPADAARLLLVTVGLALAGCFLATLLLGLSWLSQQLSQRRQSSVLLLLILLPELLREALPEMPSALAAHDWLLRLILLLVKP